MDGQTIYSAMRAAYAQLSSYQDTGDVVLVYIHDAPHPRRRTESLPFSTWFTRPNRFRFEFANREVGPPKEWDRYIVWERDGLARSWWSLRGEKESDDLRMLLAGATGVSGSSAIRVPRLLLPERLKLESNESVILLGTEVVSGILCHKLELTRAYGPYTETLWVGTDDYLIRQVFNTMHLGGENAAQLQSHIRDQVTKALAAGKITPDRAEELLRPIDKPADSFRVESTTTYMPTINQPIPDDVFCFDPPR